MKLFKGRYIKEKRKTDQFRTYGWAYSPVRLAVLLTFLTASLSTGAAQYPGANAETDYHIDVTIDRVTFVDDDSGGRLDVLGTIDADRFKRAWVQIGAGETPKRWTYAGQKRKRPIHDDVLAKIPLSSLSSNDLWQVVVYVEHSNGEVRSASKAVRLN